MPFIVAAVVLVGALCAVDLLLTFAVLRRLREHTGELARLADGHSASGPDLSHVVGQDLPDFSATSVAGALVSREVVAGSVELVGFFVPGCGPCHAQAPVFADRARDLPVGRTLAVVAGTGPDADDLVKLFSEVTEVLLDPAGSDLIKGLGIGVFPTFARLGADGAVVDAAVSIDGLKEPSRV